MRLVVSRLLVILLTYVTRLEDEYVKSLQHINPHTQEYVARLSDERPLEELAGSIQAYYDRSGSTETAATVALLRIEHMYYKHDSIAEAVRDAQAFRAAWGSRDDVHAASRKATAGVSTVEKTHPGSWLGAPQTPSSQSCDTAKSLKELCGYVYDHGDDRCRTRALLCHVAHHALHGRFHAARDLLLMSHLQEVAHDADIETQILYNRHGPPRPVRVPVGLGPRRPLVSSGDMFFKGEGTPRAGRPERALVRQVRRAGKGRAPKADALPHARQPGFARVLPFNFSNVVGGAGDGRRGGAQQTVARRAASHPRDVAPLPQTHGHLLSSSLHGAAREHAGPYSLCCQGSCVR